MDGQNIEAAGGPIDSAGSEELAGHAVGVDGVFGIRLRRCACCYVAQAEAYAT
jgi:hypothetical protein